MIKRLLMTIMVVLTVSLGAGMLSPTPVAAEDNCNRSFLGIPGLVSWHNGLEKDAKCNISSSNFSEEKFVGSVWAIVLNILSLLFAIVGYLALGFVVYGGYLYVLARGDPTRIAKGKRTVISALIGLVICILAALIINTIVSIITGAVGA